ncbi:SEC14-like protein 1 [Saccoglossus kowalevskii]|uniref:SEC14-like protein 1-like n=1 Tax=Saccoglossus kowalevskii TaxID=10224 RepID=A0ABM0MMA8_SACKO|nr:PREDICTED: SEC14-like protein 1-like [Saccoglossus kowalevskii]
MVQKYTSPVRVYKYSFEIVMAAYQRRFPTCKMIPIFLGSDILSEYESDDGAVHIVERRCRLNVEAPYLLKKIVGVEFIYFIQKNTLNRRERTLKIEAHNESFSSRVIINEHCFYSVHPDNPEWTVFEQDASLDVKSFLGFENMVEKICMKKYGENIKKGKEIILYYVNELNNEGVTHIPSWSETHTEENLPNGMVKGKIALNSPTHSATEELTEDCQLLDNGEVGACGGGGGSSKDNEVRNVDEDYIQRFLGDLNPMQESRLVQLRKWISETLKGKMPHDAILLRFLRARDFNVEKAHEMLARSLSWRKQHQVDKILKTWSPPDLLLQYFSGGWHYLDRDGRPVYILRLGNMDVKGLLKAVGEEGLLRHVLSLIEDGLRRTEEATKATGKPIGAWTFIVDLEGLSMRHLWRPGVKALLRVIEVVEDNYPETMARLLIVRAPRVFPVLWTLISPFIDENTRQKFMIYGGYDYLGKGGLADYIDPVYIPDFLNGECYCSIPEGGLVPKMLYKSLEDLYEPGERRLCSDNIYKSATVVKGTPHEVLVNIEEKDQVITWDFDVLRGDLVFSLLRCRRPISLPKEPTSVVEAVEAAIGGNNIILDKSMVSGVDYSKAESPLVCKAGESIQGTHVARMAGSYILQWKYHSPPHSITSKQHHHHHHKAKVMYYHELLNSRDFRGSMTSLQSCQSGFSSLSLSTSCSNRSLKSLNSSCPSR